MDLSVRIVYFFFFKQKTAYEMRISDWSSDVCSSDLLLPRRGLQRGAAGDQRVRRRRSGGDILARVDDPGADVGDQLPDRRRHLSAAGRLQHRQPVLPRRAQRQRSEESRVGKGWGSTVRSRWAAYLSKKK